MDEADDLLIEVAQLEQQGTKFLTIARRLSNRATRFELLPEPVGESDTTGAGTPVRGKDPTGDAEHPQAGCKGLTGQLIDPAPDDELRLPEQVGCILSRTHPAQEVPEQIFRRRLDHSRHACVRSLDLSRRGGTPSDGHSVTPHVRDAPPYRAEPTS